jgi:OmpA family
MTLVRTGPGQISTFPQVPVGGVRATLHNFDIDGPTPKPEHITFLRSSVIPILAGKNARIWLQGSASRSGTAAHNLVLSRQRADAVVAILVANGVQSAQVHSDAVGARMVTPHVSEAEMDRAVNLLAAPLAIPPPPPPRPTPPPLQRRLGSSYMPT